MHTSRMRKQLTQREVGELERKSTEKLYFWRNDGIADRWLMESVRADCTLDPVETYRRRRQRAGI